MKIEVQGEGLTADRMSALAKGAAAMGCADVNVHVTDDFASTINQLLGADTYSTDRGAAIVAGKTIVTDSGSQVVLNAAVLRDADIAVIERLGAHEAGHVLLHARGEAFRGKQHLAKTEWQWRLLCVAGPAIEEYRIERALFEMGYPVAGAGTAEHVADALTDLNIEIVESLVDPASSDPAYFSDKVLRTQSWLSNMLAYAAAYANTTFPDAVRSYSGFSRRHWDDYIGSAWHARVEFYDGVFHLQQPITIDELDRTFQAAVELEIFLLDRIGFRYSGGPEGYRFDRTISDAVCQDRLELVREEAEGAEEPEVG